MADETALVLDTGSFATRAGFANALNPASVVISSQLAQLTGTPKRYAAGAYVGSELAPTEPVDKVVAPIKQGQVHDWDAYEGLLTHVLFNELGSVKGQSPPVLYIEPHRTSKGDRETYAQLFFEALELQAMAFMDPASAATFGFNAATSLVVDIGYERTDVVPVYNWNVQTHLRRSIDIGAGHLNSYLLQLLKSEQAFASNVSANDIQKKLLLAQSIISAVGSVAPSSKALAAGKAAVAEEPYQFSPDLSFPIGLSRVRYAEALFQPSLISNETPGLIETIQSVLNHAEPEKRRSLVNNIIVVGGASQTRGLAERIVHDVTKLPNFPKPAQHEERYEAKVLSLPTHLGGISERPEWGPWCGASIASQMLFQSQNTCISRSDYNESGPGIVHFKTFNA